MNKKIEIVSSRDVKHSDQRLQSKLNAATKGQVINAVCLLGENIVRITSDAPDDDTRLSAAAEFICACLDKVDENVSGVKTPSSYKVPNGEYINELTAVFGRQGTLNKSFRDHRRAKIQEMIKKI